MCLKVTFGVPYIIKNGQRIDNDTTVCIKGNRIYLPIRIVLKASMVNASMFTRIFLERFRAVYLLVHRIMEGVSCMKSLFSKKVIQNELKESDKNRKNGTFILPDGTKYTSKYSNDYPNKGDDYLGNIKQESLILEDGTKYFGEVIDGEPHGYGILNFPDEGTYIGEIKSCTENGYGMYVLSDGVRVMGAFKDGGIDGEAMMIFPDGSKYFGSVKNNNFHGRGMVTLADGSTLAAEFKNNKIHRLVGSFDDNKTSNSSRNTSQQDVGKLLLKMTGYTALFTGSFFNQLIKLNNKSRKY